MDFGADPTGITDSTPAVAAALAACPANGCEIDFPAGAFLVSLVNVNKQTLFKGAGASTAGTSTVAKDAMSNVFGITNSSIYIRDMLFTLSVIRA